MINGSKIKKLKVIPDERGRLMEILRKDDEIFDKFGQVYVTTVKPGVVKAWHYHKKQDDHFVCLMGKVRVALFDARKKSPTYGEVNDYIMSMDDPFVVKIPKGVYHGFKGIADIESMVLNVPTRVYDYKEPDEFRLDAFENDIKYDWRK
jgi:dTDP-4-dehydrorhamnose 3,5-epimerase